MNILHDIKRNPNKGLIEVDEKFSTNHSGVFAVGGAITYPGKQDRIKSGFHEATLAAYAAAAMINPNKPQHVQYTTTTPKLHRLLGVDSPKD